jgi:phytoene desaturase
MKKAVVIGAGIGGLSAAARLANYGFEVEVFEANSRPGGKANQIIGSGFRFDSGPSLITMPFVIENLFAELGEDLNSYLKIEPLDILCRYHFDDGKILDAHSNIEMLKKEFADKLNVDSTALQGYLDYSKTIYDLTADLFMFSDFSNWKNFLNRKSLNTLININKIDPFRTMHEANHSFFSEATAVQIFDRYATYNGSNPFKAPATLNIIQHVEYNLGGYTIKNGIYELPNALYKLCSKKGVKFNFECKVISINYSRKRVDGITYEKNNERVEVGCNIVLSNSDVNYTYQKLLPELVSRSKNKYSKLEPSSSAVVFYWGVKGTYPNLKTHNILFSNNYESEFSDLFDRKIIHNDPTIYVYISSKNNSTDAPPEHENWFVMVNAPYNSGQNWDDELIRLKGILIEKIRLITGICLSDKIVFEKTLTPLEIEEQTSSSRGSLYGISSNNKYSAFFRQKNRSTDLQGLYFCGGSAHPGGGIPLVILSGKIATDLIKRDYA